MVAETEVDGCDLNRTTGLSDLTGGSAKRGRGGDKPGRLRHPEQ